MKKLLFAITAIILVLLIANALADSIVQTLNVTILPSIEVFSPVENKIYDTRMIMLDLNLNEKASSLRYNINNGKFTTICLNCMFYSKIKPFDDGKNNLTIQAITSSGVIIKSINFIVDSKKPIIKYVELKKGFTLGDFKIDFEEANPTSLILYYGNDAVGYRNEELNLSKCIQKKNERNCSTSVNLEDYDQQKIQYWFVLKDILNRQDESEIKILSVDFIPPIITDLELIDKKWYTKLKLEIEEPNFDFANYIDYAEKNPKWKIMCTKLVSGICEKNLFLKKGAHNISINASDIAGNSADKFFYFTID